MIQAMAPRPKNPRPGIPYRSKLNEHIDEIARLRKTKPYPTTYKEIARVLNEKYTLGISPNAVWAFVRNRALGRGRKPKYEIPADLLRSAPHQPPPATAQQPVEDERPDWEPRPEPSDGLTEYQRKRRAKWRQEKENPPQ
jgi:hypothetical protein